jgi:hypothetical protein
LALSKADVYLKISTNNALFHAACWRDFVTFRSGMFFMLKKSARDAEYFSPWTLSAELP